MEINPQCYLSSLHLAGKKKPIIYGQSGAEKGVIGDRTAAYLRLGYGINAAHIDTGYYFRFVPYKLARRMINMGGVLPQSADWHAYMEELDPKIVEDTLATFGLQMDVRGMPVYTDEDSPIDPFELKRKEIGYAAGHLGQNRQAQAVISAIIQSHQDQLGIDVVIADGRTHTISYELKKASNGTSEFQNRVHIIPLYIQRPEELALHVALREVPFDNPVDPNLPLVEQEALLKEARVYMYERNIKDGENAQPFGYSFYSEHFLNGYRDNMTVSEVWDQIRRRSDVIGQEYAALIFHLTNGYPVEEIPNIRRATLNNGNLGFTIAPI